MNWLSVGNVHSTLCFPEPQVITSPTQLSELAEYSLRTRPVHPPLLFSEEDPGVTIDLLQGKERKKIHGRREYHKTYN